MPLNIFKHLYIFLNETFMNSDIQLILKMSITLYISCKNHFKENIILTLLLLYLGE